VRRRRRSADVVGNFVVILVTIEIDSSNFADGSFSLSCDGEYRPPVRGWFLLANSEDFIGIARRVMDELVNCIPSSFVVIETDIECGFEFVHDLRREGEWFSSMKLL
jgi:hypothetical protein